MRRIRPLRYLAILALFPAFALLFWITALVASNVLGLLTVGVNVHSLSLASYAADSAPRPAPLSFRVLEDAQQDAGGSPVRATASAVPSGPGQPTPIPLPSRSS